MAASAAPAERGGPSLASLPDSALDAIFSKCTMSDRLQRLSLVCKQWRDLCATPHLVSKVAVKGTGDGALQRMRSLQLWLARKWGLDGKEVPNAAHVRELSLTLSYLGEGALENMQLVVAAAVSCSPNLRQFAIRLEGQQQLQLVLSSWLCGLTRLTQLDVVAARVQCSVSLAGLTALEHLTVGAHQVVQPTGSWLPPRLTTLIWGPTKLPEQATSLQQLQQVHLKIPHLMTPAAAAAFAGSAAVMARLAPSFCSLTLEGRLAAIPPELAALAGRLPRLTLITTHPAVVDIGGISALTSLSTLGVRGACGVAPTTSLQLLSRLQQLWICNGPRNADGPSHALGPAPANQPVLRSLPPGGWLGGLTHLALSYDVLFGSLGVLPAATHLKSLHILRLQCMPAVPPPGEPQPDWAALCEWLCTHPPLRRLALNCRFGMPAQLPELMRALATSRPGVSIDVCR